MAKHPVEIIRSAAAKAGIPASFGGGAALSARAGRTVRRAIGRFLCCLALVAIGCSKGYDPEPPASQAAPLPNITIARLHELCSGGAVVIREPLVISGRVTTSDLSGNFYRTLCIEEERAAVEIRLGTEESHNRYPLGCRLCLRLEGLCIERSRGVLQVGPPAPASAGSAVDYFRSQALVDEYLFRVASEEPLAGRILDVGELSPELCGTLVVIPGLEYRPAEETAEETGEEAEEVAKDGIEEEAEDGSEEEAAEDDRCWRGYRRFEDETGASIHTYVSSYARFAEKKLPEGAAALRGILQREESGKYKGYILKLRDENDCMD